MKADLVIQRDIEFRMRDGVILRGDVFRPRTLSKVPAIPLRTPYEKESSRVAASMLHGLRPAVCAAAGYAFVLQDARGCGASEGIPSAFGPIEDRNFSIVNSQGRIEATVVFPWGIGNETWNRTKGHYQNLGIGPWGELYSLIAPPFANTGTFKNEAGDRFPLYEPDPKGTSQLVVVRNYLRLFGRLNDSGVRSFPRSAAAAPHTRG